MVGDVQAGDIPKSSRYLLDVGPLTSAWRGYKRKPGTARPWLPTPSPEQAEAIRKRRSLSTLHKHSRKARAQIREAKQKGYVPRTAKEIENELSEKLHRGEASEFRKAPGVEVVKGTGVIAHIAGPSGSGKTTILERIKEKHPNIVTKDLDDLDDVAKAELGITGRKRNWSDEKLTKFYAKKQEVLDRFLAENEGKDIVLAGHHMAAGPPELAEAWSLKVPGRKILLNTGARKSALRRSQRGDHPGTDNRPKYRVEAKKDIKELTSRGYKKKSSRQIMRMVKVSKHTRRLAGGKTVAVKAHTRGSSRGTLTEKLGARVTDDKKKRRRKAAAIAGGTLAGGVGMLVARKGGRADLLYNLKNPLKGRWGPRLLGTKSKDPDLDKPVPSDVVRQATEVVKRLRKSGVDLNHARIALTGLPGSGKSTLAKEITRQLRARHGVHGQPKPALKRSSFFPEEGIGQSKGRTILSKSWDLDKIPHYMYDAGDAAKKKRFLRKAPSFKVFEQSSLLATGGGRGYDALIHVDPPKAVRDARILKRGRGALQLEWVNMKKIDDKTKEVFSNTPGKTLPSVGPIRLKVTRKAPTPDFTPLSSKERINRGEAKKYVAAAAAGGVGGGIIEGLVSNREKKASLQLAPSKLIVSRST
jgi:GTPase SAR1 family protein